MERTSVTSSMISAVGYEAETQTLEVEFNNGGVFQYFGVPGKEHEALMAAGSVGKYFNANIRDKYPTTKL